MTAPFLKPAIDAAAARAINDLFEVLIRGRASGDAAALERFRAGVKATLGARDDALKVAEEVG